MTRTAFYVSREQLVEDNSRLISEKIALRKALAGCVEQNLNCLYHHYGDNPEGCSVPEYIQRAQELLK